MNSNHYWPDVILVNGCSSSGKSTLCKTLQDSLSEPYLHFGFDDLVFMSPKRYYGDSDSAFQSKKNHFIQQGVEMIEVQKENEPLTIEAIFGPVFQKIIKSMPAVVATLVREGNKVIFDHVFHDQKMYDDFQFYLGNLNILKVGVYCPLEILEQREKSRGDRVLGRARGLFPIVHQFCDYDIKVDTHESATIDIITNIKKYLNKN